MEQFPNKFIEHQEKKEDPRLKVLIACDARGSKEMMVGGKRRHPRNSFRRWAKRNNLDNIRFAFTDKADDIQRLTEEKNPDILVMGSLSNENNNPIEFDESDEREKIITSIRNNREVKKQPLIINYFLFDLARLSNKKKHVLNAGADFVTSLNSLDLFALFKKAQSVPEIIGNIEDTYGDKMLENKQGFYKEYKDKLAERSEVTADTEKELEILENIFEKNDVKKVLDAGGGAGRLAIPLSEKGYEMTNADSSKALIEKMKEKTSKVEGIQIDLRKIPLQDKKFDAVTYNWHVFCDVLGVKSKKQVLSEAYRVLKNKGVLVLDLPDRKESEEKKDGIYINYPGGESVFVGYIPNEKEMIEYLEEAGFKNIEIKKWETKEKFPKVTFTAIKDQ